MADFFSSSRLGSADAFIFNVHPVNKVYQGWWPSAALRIVHTFSSFVPLHVPVTVCRPPAIAFLYKWPRVTTKSAYLLALTGALEAGERRNPQYCVGTVPVGLMINVTQATCPSCRRVEAAERVRSDQQAVSAVVDMMPSLLGLHRAGIVYRCLKGRRLCMNYNQACNQGGPPLQNRSFAIFRVVHDRAIEMSKATTLVSNTPDDNLRI